MFEIAEELDDTTDVSLAEVLTDSLYGTETVDMEVVDGDVGTTE